MANTKQIKQFDPFKNLILDDYEKDLQASIARGEWEAIPEKESQEIRKMFQQAAKRHIELRQSKKITIRLNQSDLIKLKVKAKRKNIPYQTLLGALIRDYVEDKYKAEL